MLSRPIVEPPPTAVDRLTGLIPMGLAYGALRLARADQAAEEASSNQPASCVTEGT